MKDLTATQVRALNRLHGQQSNQDRILDWTHSIGSRFQLVTMLESRPLGVVEEIVETLENIQLFGKSSDYYRRPYL